VHSHQKWQKPPRSGIRCLLKRINQNNQGNEKFARKNGDIDT
jgi:hypothetical protein